MTKNALILGVSGQDGAYLAHFLNQKGYRVHGTSRDPAATSFAGLDRLELRGSVTLHGLDLLDIDAVSALLHAIRPSEIYHLAGQSSVGLSFSQPLQTITSIATSTLILLEALRTMKSDARVFNTGSSECYGHCDVAAKETTPFDPRSAYGVARVSSFWTAKNYRDAYGMYVATGILANHESPLRPSHFVTHKIIQAVARIRDASPERLKLGNIEVQRDWGWAPEFMEAYWLLLQADRPADYNIATGQTNSLQEFVREAFAVVGLDWQDHADADGSLLRPTEFLTTKVDPSRIAIDLGWRARYKMGDVIRFLLAREADGGLGPLPWGDAPQAVAG